MKVNQVFFQSSLIEECEGNHLAEWHTWQILMLLNFLTK